MSGPEKPPLVATGRNPWTVLVDSGGDASLVEIPSDANEHADATKWPVLLCHYEESRLREIARLHNESRAPMSVPFTLRYPWHFKEYPTDPAPTYQGQVAP